MIRRSTISRPAYAAVLVLFAALGTAACDTVEPGGSGVLVLEGFLDAGAPLPPLTLRQTMPLDEPYDSVRAAVSDARMDLVLGGRAVSYAPDPARPGRYLPTAEVVVPPRVSFVLSVRRGADEARAVSAVPPPVRLADVLVRVPDRPVPAVVLDSLRLRAVEMDSLRFDSLGTGTGQGFVYPIEVTLTWADDLTPADTLFWVRASLQPAVDAAPDLLAFFLRGEQVLRERSLPRVAGRRQWTGVYAVPVADVDAPLPPHVLNVSLLRSGEDYARFATSRDAPTRREPRSNVAGGTGIVAGISVDTRRITVGGE